MENNEDGSEVQKTSEVAEETTETPELTPEEIKDLKVKAEASSQNFERAKKAEQDLKEAREKLKSVSPSEKQDLSMKDVLFLAKTDIHQDDVDSMLKWAKADGIDLKETYANYKEVLDVRAEKRKSAETANVSNVRRTPQKMTDEVLLEKASKNDLPEDDEGIERLIKAKASRRE